MFAAGPSLQVGAVLSCVHTFSNAKCLLHRYCAVVRWPDWHHMLPGGGLERASCSMLSEDCLPFHAKGLVIVLVDVMCTPAAWTRHLFGTPSAAGFDSGCWSAKYTGNVTSFSLDLVRTMRPITYGPCETVFGAPLSRAATVSRWPSCVTVSMALQSRRSPMDLGKGLRLCCMPWACEKKSSRVEICAMCQPMDHRGSTAMA